MLKLTKKCLPMAVAIFVISWYAPVSADMLTVEVTPHKSVVVLGEPVLISATVANTGPEPVKLIHHNAPTLVRERWSVVDLKLGQGEAQPKRWSDELRELIEASHKFLPPGEIISVDLVMLYNRENGFFATTPGKYWIQGRIVIAPSPYVEILTTPISIEVREPPRAERVVWQWLNEHKDVYGRLVQVPWEAKLSEEFVQECDRICTETTSAYGEYLALFLSRWYREGPNKDAAKSQRFAEIAKAKASSEKVRTEAEKLLPQQASP
ncbi:MAG: hypothetical protein AABZ47_02155 [Planctomycetota bacterium]